MTRYTIVERTSAAPWAVSGSRLLLTLDTSEDDAVSAWSERVSDARMEPGVARRRIALVCRGDVIKEWDRKD